MYKGWLKGNEARGPSQHNCAHTRNSHYIQMLIHCTSIIRIKFPASQEETEAQSTQDARAQIRPQTLWCCLRAVWTPPFTYTVSICFASFAHPMWMRLTLWPCGFRPSVHGSPSTLSISHFSDSGQKFLHPQILVNFFSPPKKEECYCYILVSFSHCAYLLFQLWVNQGATQCHQAKHSAVPTNSLELCSFLCCPLCMEVGGVWFELHAVSKYRWVPLNPTKQHQVKTFWLRWIVRIYDEA